MQCKPLLAWSPPGDKDEAACLSLQGQDHLWLSDTHQEINRFKWVPHDAERAYAD